MCAIIQEDRTLITDKDGKTIVGCHIKIRDEKYQSTPYPTEHIWITMELEKYLQLVKNTKSIEQLEREMYLTYTSGLVGRAAAT